MKSADADLIDTLNSLSQDERADLLEFLGAGMASQDPQAQSMLEASAWLHRETGKKQKN